MSSSSWAWLRMLLLACGCLFAGGISAQENGRYPLEELRDGHWLRVKGALDDTGRFVAVEAELLEPQRYETLLGQVALDQDSSSNFELLGIAVESSASTEWEGSPLASLAGQRVRVEGFYRGPHRFEARDIALREAGRDRLEGRVYAPRLVPGGLEARLLHQPVFLPVGLELESSAPPASLTLAPAKVYARPQEQALVDPDDELVQSLRLFSNLRLGGQVEWSGSREDEFDINEAVDRDRSENGLALRLRLSFEPKTKFLASDFSATAELRVTHAWREEQDAGASQPGDERLGETWAAWRNVGGSGFSLQLGRQDFDDPREWLYDQNLDAARLFWARPNLALELSISTTLSSGSPEEQDTDNLILYVSNNQTRKHLAFYIIDRRERGVLDDFPIWFGLRALGEFVPATRSWTEFSLRRGYRDDTDLTGWALDLGATFSPSGLAPWNFTMGQALASGDKQPLDGVDNAFRQTGLQDNNARFEGVTSFRYYGELLDPELSNISILTLGLGRELGEKSSIDLVWHRYRQDELSAGGLFSQIKAQPEGFDRDLGQELDLVLGSRRISNLDLELVAGWFKPGDAFAQQDMAFVVSAHVRYRF